MNPHTWWFLARAGGLVAWALLTMTVLWGILLRSRLAPKGKAPAVLALHRFLAGLAVLFTAAHLAGLMLDGYIGFGWTDVLVPFAASWRPVPVALGVLAFYSMIAVAVTSMAIRRLPRRWWSRIHRSAYAMFWFATLHAATAGTDANNPMVAMLLAGAGGAVLFGMVVRSLRAVKSARRVPAARPAPEALLQPSGQG